VSKLPAQIRNLAIALENLPEGRHFGRVVAVQGMLAEVGGIEHKVPVGGRCLLSAADGHKIPCEVVGFRSGHALLMALGRLDGVALGCRADILDSKPAIRPNKAWLGRVINALGEPIDGKGPLPQGTISVPLHNSPPLAHARQRMGGKMDLGVRAINTMLCCVKGQRLGIFAGSGVGKSVLMSMMARYTAADVSVIGLVGERGREVQEFLEDDLGPEGLARSVVIVATSDEAPLLRRQAAWTTLAVAEYFRDEGRDVLCMMDSLTRFAMAQREIGLASGEPPASKGYPPSTFPELARLLERAGPGAQGAGSITGLFTVLVEGDDHNEPVADAARGILDGHIVLERKIAERGRYPAINILRSISRSMPACNTKEETALIGRTRRLLSTYEDMAELIRLGAYKHGSDPAVDEAIAYHEALESFLSQDRNESCPLDKSWQKMAEVLK